MSDSDTSNDDKVTRSNVIDKVEAYEGHPLDTIHIHLKNPNRTKTEIGALF